MLDLFKEEIFLRNDGVFHVPVLKDYFQLMQNKYSALNPLSVITEDKHFFVLTSDEELAKKIWLSCGDSSFLS